MRVWVLTREHSAYDQFGEYFVDVFCSKLTSAQLIENGVAEYRVAHTLNGGGHCMDDEVWFNLSEIELKNNITGE